MMTIILHNMGPFDKNVAVFDDNQNEFQVFNGVVPNLQNSTCQIVENSSGEGDVHYRINGGPLIGSGQMSPGDTINL